MDKDTIVIENVPLSFDLQALGKRLRIQEGQTAIMKRLEKLAGQALEVASPRAVAMLKALEVVDEEHVRVGGVSFTSALVREKMGERGRVFPYLATEGTEMARWGQSLDSSLDLVFAGALRQAAVKQYETLLEERVTEQFGMEQVSSMNPGSLRAWPLTQQEQLFQVLSPFPDKLGVTLLPTHLMEPAYSVSGIFFQTDTKYYNCQLCPRENCPNRKAPSTVI